MPDSQAEHSRHLGRRHRHLEPELLQPRHDGLLHAQHRPDRRRGNAFHRFLRRAELHGGPVVVHHRPERLPHRHEQGRDARRGCRSAEGGPDDRRAAQAAGLRDRPVRQEPPRRPEQVPADRARVRRVLRQPLPPQRRGRTRDTRTTPPRRRRRCCARHCCPVASSIPGRPTRTPARSTTGTARSASNASRTPDR